MKTYKKYFCLFIALVTVLAMLTGCGDKKDEKEKDDGAFSYSDGIDKNGFLEGITALDYVELPDYNALVIPSDAHTITDETLQAEIDGLLADYSTDEEIKDRAVVDGDTVNIDYVGSVDGVEFEGGSTGGEGAEVTIGETTYIDDFLEQLIGHKPGETFDINVTFPTPYENNEELSGKDAVFDTTINYIVKKVDVELTDAFVEENLSEEYGWKTIAEMEDGLYAGLQEDAISMYIQEYLSSDVTVKSVPDSLMKYEENAMVKYYTENAESYGMDLEEFLTSFVGVSSLDELISSSADANKQSAQFALVIQAIAEDAKIKASDDDVADYFKEVVGADDYSEYEKSYGMPYLKQSVLTQKVMNDLIEHATLA
jgi:trigger factor